MLPPGGSGEEATSKLFRVVTRSLLPLLHGPYFRTSCLSAWDVLAPRTYFFQYSFILASRDPCVLLFCSQAEKALDIF